MTTTTTNLGLLIGQNTDNANTYIVTNLGTNWNLLDAHDHSGTTKALAVQVLTQLVATSGSPTAYLITGGAHTTLTAATEAIDVNINLARTVQFATGGITTQRAMVIQAPTYGFVGASTITDTATLAITGPPVAGTNATLTRTYALWVQSGSVRFQGVNFALGTTPNTNAGIKTGGTITASSATAYGGYIGPTVTAAANSDVLYGVRIVPTFSDAGKTSVQHWFLYIDDGGSSASADTMLLGLTTTAAADTTGFVWMPSVAGAQTGVPANSAANAVPFRFDTTNGRLYSYYGAAWHYVAFT